MVKAMEDKIKLTVLMPTLNEEKSIASMVDYIRRNAKDYDLEILIVDSSTDNTPKIAEELGVRVIRQRKQGPGKAIIAGMKEARGDAVIATDCDGTYPMEDIPKFVGYWKDGYALVNGNRLNEMNKAMPRMNRFGNWLFAFMMRILYGIPTRDITSGMRLYGKDLINSSEWETNYSFWAEIMIKARRRGFKFKELPIKYKERIGTPTINIWRSGRAYILCLLKYRFNLGFIDPRML